MADPHRYPPIDDNARDRIRLRIIEGLSVRATAESVGQSKKSVARVIREMGGVNKIREGA